MSCMLPFPVTRIERVDLRISQDTSGHRQADYETTGPAVTPPPRALPPSAFSPFSSPSKSEFDEPPAKPHGLRKSMENAMHKFSKIRDRAKSRLTGLSGSSKNEQKPPAEISVGSAVLMGSSLMLESSHTLVPIRPSPLPPPPPEPAKNEAHRVTIDRLHQELCLFEQWQKEQGWATTHLSDLPEDEVHTPRRSAAPSLADSWEDDIDKASIRASSGTALSSPVDPGISTSFVGELTWKNEVPSTADPGLSTTSTDKVSPRKDDAGETLRRLEEEQLKRWQDKSGLWKGPSSPNDVQHTWQPVYEYWRQLMGWTPAELLEHYSRGWRPPENADKPRRSSKDSTAEAVAETETRAAQVAKTYRQLIEEDLEKRNMASSASSRKVGTASWPMDKDLMPQTRAETRVEGKARESYTPGHSRPRIRKAPREPSRLFGNKFENPRRGPLPAKPPHLSPTGPGSPVSAQSGSTLRPPTVREVISAERDSQGYFISPQLVPQIRIPNLRPPNYVNHYEADEMPSWL